MPALELPLVTTLRIIPLISTGNAFHPTVSASLSTKNKSVFPGRQAHIAYQNEGSRAGVPVSVSLPYFFCKSLSFTFYLILTVYSVCPRKLRRLGLEGFLAVNCFRNMRAKHRHGRVCDSFITFLALSCPLLGLFLFGLLRNGSPSYRCRLRRPQRPCKILSSPRIRYPSIRMPYGHNNPLHSH